MTLTLHVMSKFEVLRVLERLIDCDVPPCLEHHHRDGTTRERISDDKLSDDVQSHLLVRNRLYHTDGHEIDHGDK